MKLQVDEATVVVHDRRALLALLRGSRGLGDAYVAGWWDCDDLTGLVQALARRTAPLVRRLDAAGAALRPLTDPVARARRRPDRARDRRNIHAHYDIGNDFYALMLDNTMTYSCAVFEPPGISLADAQEAKFERLCRRLGLGPGDHVVEIGTGWGGFAVHAAGRHGARVTTTTISDEQHRYAGKRIAEAGLADLVTVLDLDYRDVTGRYDALVSVEMIEAVDWRDHGTFFGTVARLLRPGGRAALQAIVIDDRAFERAKHHDDFIRASVFPGGCLPSIASIAAGASRAGMRLVELEEIGHHYPATLRAWRHNVHAAGAEVADLGLDRRFRRLWDLYLAYCEAGFLERRVGVVQVVLERPA